MLADSHIHLFENGYKGSGTVEISQYEDLREKYAIECALVIGFEGESWALGNNAYIATLARTRRWIHPLAFVEPRNIRVTHLEELLSSGFEGVTLYIFSELEVLDLLAIPDSAWAWLVEHKWLISVNSRGNYWNPWLDVMSKRPQLVLLIAHLGLPKIDLDRLTPEDIALELRTIAKLHNYNNVYLKLSGFYALEQVQPVYPYPSLNKFLLFIVNNFNPNRLIWGSDFSPALSTVSFPQTFEHFSQLDFLQQNDAERILHQNLTQLIAKLA